MTKRWMRSAMGTAMVAGLAVAGALFLFGRPAMADMMGGTAPHAHMGSDHASMHGQMGQMMKGHGGMMGANMGAMHATMAPMHEKMQAEIAAILSISVEDLNKALADGKEIATLAAEKSLDPVKVKEAITATHKAMLDELVAAETLTQAQADQMLEQMESGGMMGPMGMMNQNGAHCDQAPVTNS